MTRNGPLFIKQLLVNTTNECLYIVQRSFHKNVMGSKLTFLNFICSNLYSTDQATILHRLRLLSCHDMCKLWLNTLGPRQNGRLFAEDTFKRIFLNENVGISMKIWLKFVHKGPINNIPALAQIMAWRRPGDKPLSEPMVVRLPTNICVTRPQWVNSLSL